MELWVANTEGIEEKEKIVGENPPVIRQSFASNQLSPGDLWKIYILASDTDGDMDKILAVVEQSGTGVYPVSIIKIRGENGRELSGYVYLDTTNPRYGYGFLNNQELTVSIQIKDKAGHTSGSVTHKVHLLSRQYPKSPPVGIFKEEALGPIMVELRPVTPRR